MIPASIAGHVIELLVLADRGPGPVDRLVSGFLRERQYLGSRDRRTISDVLFGVIRHRRLLETILEEFLRLHPAYSTIDAPARRYLPLLVIHSSIFPGLFAEVPPPPEELRPLWTPYFPDLDPAAFVSWIAGAKDLGFLMEAPEVMLAVKHSFQDWMVADWLSRWPSEAEDLLTALNRPGVVSLRVNRLKTDRDACRERLVAEGIAATDASFPDSALSVSKRFNQNASAAFKEGWYEIQDMGSQVISLACAPQSGHLVVDGCAGAGGKSLHLADLMKNKGKIIAVDTDPARLKELTVRARRGGAGIILAVAKKDFDPKRYDARADVVLVDAPCSGSGTIRRNPALKWSIREDEVARFASRQLDLLNIYAPLVKRGGRLVYSTCSLFSAENEAVVGRFLSCHAGFRPLDVSGTIPWGIEKGAHDSLTLLPHRHPTDGFFISVLERP